MSLIKIMDEIWSSRENKLPPGAYQIRSGKRFFLDLKRDINRIESLKLQERILADKNGLISGKTLFPIILKLWNWKDILPGTKVTSPSTKEELLRLHYFGISPELENFANLVLWPEKSRHSYNTLNQIYRAIDAGKQPLIYFEGDYRIRLPNEIHPYRYSKIETELEDKIFEWRYIPWLKEIGDTIFEHRSPTGYRKIFLNVKDIDYAYVYPKICIGIVKDVLRSTGEIKLKLPYLNNNIKRKYLFAKILLESETLDITSGDIIYFVLLETIHNNSKFIPERYIYYTHSADFIDILGHLTAFVLYNKYLDKYGLYLMSVSEFQRIYKRILTSASRYCRECARVEGLIDWELLFGSYLEPFFTIVGRGIYYVPQILHHKTYLESIVGVDMSREDILLKIDELLLESRESKKNFSKLDLIKLMNIMGINHISELRSILDLAGKIAFIKQLNRIQKSSIWGWA